MIRDGVRPATPADINPVCRLLHDKMSRRLAPARWRRLMTYGWLEKKPDLGRVAVAEGRVVGFVGMDHADRDVAGRRERVVNICAWYLDKDHRGRGLGAELMRQATEDEAMSYTILTSSSRTLGLLDRIGYRILDQDRRLWSRRESPQGPAAAGGGTGTPLEITRHPARILSRAGEQERRILRDHADLPIAPVLIADGKESCLAVFSVKKKGEAVTYFDALHIANPPFFAARAQAIADSLLPQGGKAVLAADTRLLGPHAAGGTVERLPVARYYKSTRLKPGDIDNMYSEVQLLDLKLD
jgi:GNAT superfamily N-acetyltransferase